MLDNDLIRVLSARLDEAVASAGWGFAVIQKQQPTQQGTPLEPSVFFEKLFDNIYGYSGYSSEIVEVDDLEQMRETTTQLVSTAFQISAWVIQNPKDLTLPTASDVVNYLNLYLRTKKSLRALKSVGLNILRVTEVRNPYTEDDRHRNEATPSFDIYLTHDRSITLDVDSVNSVKGEVYGF